MVDRRLVEQLDSVEPEKRKVAIQQLARTKDPDAIRYLEAAARSDSDRSVRELAGKAIAYINRQNEGSTGRAADSTPLEAKPPAGKTVPERFAPPAWPEVFRESGWIHNGLE